MDFWTRFSHFFTWVTKTERKKFLISISLKDITAQENINKHNDIVKFHTTLKLDPRLQIRIFLP